MISWISYFINLSFILVFSCDFFTCTYRKMVKYQSIVTNIFILCLVIFNVAIIIVIISVEDCYVNQVFMTLTECFGYLKARTHVWRFWFLFSSWSSHYVKPLLLWKKLFSVFESLLSNLASYFKTNHFIDFVFWSN